MLLPFFVAAASWWFVINAVTAGLYYWDKRAAKRGSWRVSEADLLVTSALGGWPAAIFVGRRIRHKTSKRSYRLKFAGAIVVHVVAVVGVLGWASRW